MHSPDQTIQRPEGRRALRILGQLLLGLLGIFVVLVVVALFDARAGRDKLPRGLTVAGSPVGRMTRAELDVVLESLRTSYDNANVPVTVQADSGQPDAASFELKGNQLRAQVDEASLRRTLYRVGRTGSTWNRVQGYVDSWLETKVIPVPVRVDPATITTAVRTVEADYPGRPTDPSLRLINDRWELQGGKPGLAIDTPKLSSSIEQSLRWGPNSKPVTVRRTTVPSRYTDSELAGLVTQANKLTNDPLVVLVDGKQITLSPTEIRRWAQPTIADSKVSMTLSASPTTTAVEIKAGSVGRSATDARLDVDDELNVTVTPAITGQRCCAADSIDRLNAALVADQRTPVTLDLVEYEADVSTKDIEALGIKESIGTFTTKHAAGETRVKNIHRIADLLRGVIIKPGETFSVNDTIGPRTKANGFFSAGVIEGGIFKEDYGGGISQFATTMFNAAFFGGLDLVEYQSHSLYISRYPYGREATLSFPNPDLKIRNNTPHAVMIWPTYTASTITVTLLSTPYVKGEVINQTKDGFRLCTIVYTHRLRTYVDGRTEKDTTQAQYRPSEGQDCNGRLTPAAQEKERERAARQRERDKARAARQRERERARAARAAQPAAQPADQPAG
jgi:vancomycin resistance protein YoaR